MASLFQVLILAQVYLFSRGQTDLQCALRGECDLGNFPMPLIDARSDDANAEVQFVCVVPSNPRGTLTVTWWFDKDGIEGNEVEIVPTDMPEMFCTPSPNILIVSNVGVEYEGLFLCTLTESEAPSSEIPPKRPLGCLFVLGQGEFTSCETEECFDETILVREGGIAELDVRIMFRDGGICTNQGVQVLRVTKDSQPEFVYLCSNLGSFRVEPCVNGNHPRFTVVNAGNCTVDCKYNILLRLLNFNESDEGVYAVLVNFESIGDTRQKSLTRRFRFVLDNGGTSQATQLPGAADKSAQINIGATVGGVIGGILVVVVIAVIVIVTLYWYKVRASPIEEPLAMKKTEEKEFLNNFADSTVDTGTELNGREKGSSFIAESCNLSGDKFSLPAFV